MREKAVLEELGNTVAERRRQLGIEQGELARRIGKSASYVSRIEAGLVTPSLEVTEAIATVLEIPKDALHRLTLGAQVIRLAASHLSLAELKTALRYLCSEDSPIDRAVSWVAGFEKPTA